ncbi:MAG TPA: hypothetical protein VMG08_16600 [Allosphingosinicella sp.]|nr:hypothetical protein [Allosphingosinicella sp.]
MKAWLIALALALLPAMAAAAPVRMTIAPTATGVRITYDLPAPVRSFATRMAGADSPPAGTHIAAVEAGLTYSRGRIEAATPFRRATLLIAPDDGEVDSIYPLLSRVEGRGFVLFAPYVTPAGPLAARVATGGGRSRALGRDEAAGGYVLVGVTPGARGAVRGLAGTTLPPALERRLFDRAGALLAFYTRRLGRRPPATPILVVNYVNTPAGPSRWMFRGDVTPNGIVFLRFNATPQQLAEPQSTRRYTSFLAHELFHLWNRRTGMHAITEAWLHEGSAEYFAWLATDALWPGEVDLGRNLARAAAACGLFLADRALASLPEGEAMQMRYHCGPVAQWAADAGVRAASGGRRTGFDLWAGLLRGGRGGYSVAAFLAATRAQAPATAPFIAGLAESGVHWDALAPALNAAGARVEARPATQATLAFLATRAIARATCDDFWGAGTDENGPFFSAPPCGLPGQFAHVARVDALEPKTDIGAYEAYVRGVCARGGELSAVIRAENGESRRSLRCTQPLPQPIPDFHIVRALPPNPVSPPGRSSP